LSSEIKQTNGAVQALCSSAIGLLALLIAFIGYTAFTGKAGDDPWRPIDAVHLCFAAVAVVALLVVPWTVSRGSNEYDLSTINRARVLYALGASCTLVTIVVVLGRSFFRK